MRFEPTPRRPSAESVTPMINVSFLLLIFFLMTATIAPPEPLGAEPPETARDGPAPEPTALSLGVDGAVAYGALRGDAAEAAALSAARETGRPLVLRADRRAEAAALSQLARRLDAAGAPGLRLVTAPTR